MHGEYKTPGGKLVVVDTQEKNGCLQHVKVSGDFFLEPDEALDRITAALEGAPISLSMTELSDRITKSLAPDDVLFGFSSDAVAKAVRRALGLATSWEHIDFEVIHGPEVNPMINVALDEVLPAEVAAGRRKPFLRFWEWNAAQVVIGSFQSYENEIDQSGVDKHEIMVSRRITGGGAMFMEPGNCITYSLVVPTSLVDGMTFEQSYAFLDQWVMEALEKVGIKAHYVPLNDIASGKGKIGGAAQKRFASGITLHHVTMAYDIDNEKMLEVIRIGKEKLRDKGIRSAVKRVDPMRSQTGMSREAIMQVFFEYFKEKYQASIGEITKSELEEAKKLCVAKFATTEWIHRLP